MTLLQSTIFSKENTISLKAEYFQNICESSPLGIFVTNSEQQWVYANPAYYKISGINGSQSQDNSWSNAIHPNDRKRVLCNWRKKTQKDMPFQSEIRYLHPYGSVVWVRLNIAAMYEGKAISGYVHTFEDITERKSREARIQQAEEELYAEKERAQVTLNSIGDAVLATNVSNCISYLNKVAEDMTGWSNVQAIGKPIDEVLNIINGDTREQAQIPTDIVIAEDRNMKLAANCVLISKDGTECYIEDSAAPIHNRQGQVTGAVLVFHDISVSRAMSSKMARMAQHDALTDLPNRVMLTERLTQAMGLAKRHGTKLGLMYLDLDLFKQVNDSLGHKVGDLLLQSVAKRLVSCVRATDTVCRQGGDEFIILLVNMEDSQDATRIAESLMSAFANPHSIQGHLLYITLSIGISVYPEDGESVDTIMQNADLAMYHAKNNGRNNFHFFKEEMNQRVLRRLFVINGLRQALKKQEFELYYQPKFNLASGKISGMQALIRWNDPKRGIVSPVSFIDIAEESGLIVPMGYWVIIEACRQVQQWQEAGLAVVPVAINVSVIEFYHKNYLAGVATALKQTCLNPALLELELTENVLMDDIESSAQVLDALKIMGVSLAINNFGIGYSNLSYLKRFPINTLKIDKSLIRDVTTDVDDATIVNTLIGMGKSLKHKVIAEGIETAQQLAYLENLHCDEGQGYLFSPPLTAEDFGKFLHCHSKS